MRQGAEGLRRRLAVLACSLLQHILPADLRAWAHAIRCETDAIENDGEALLFAFASLGGLAPRAFAFRLFRAWGALASGDFVMNMEEAMARPRLIGFMCAGGAVTLGLLHMVLAGAPAHYMLINVAALAIGLTILAVAVPLAGMLRLGSATLLLTAAAALLATAVFGNRVDGAARWVAVGSLFIQPSLILLPMMIVAFVRRRDAASTAAMIIAALAMALQPDRAMMAMLFAGMALLATLLPDRYTLTAWIVATLGLAVTLGRPDTLPAVPFVDQILYSAFDVHPVAGIAVLAGSALLVVPAILGWFSHGGQRHLHAVFGCVWLAAICAAALGNYPTPIVGYGGSAVIGYVLSVAMLPPRTLPRAAERGPARHGHGDDRAEPMRRLDTVQAA